MQDMLYSLPTCAENYMALILSQLKGKELGNV